MADTPPGPVPKDGPFSSIRRLRSSAGVPAEAEATAEPVAEAAPERVPQENCFSFFKGAEDILAPKEGKAFEWDHAAAKVRENLNDAMNAKNVAFLLGSGCSSYQTDTAQVGIPTMKPMAAKFIGTVGAEGDDYLTTDAERRIMQERLGLDITADEYAQNLERLMEALYSFEFVLKRSNNEQLTGASDTVRSVIDKITRYILRNCTSGAFSEGDETVSNLYQAFYRKLIYRDRALPRPWIFSTNYDLFNEVAMDRVGVPYFNGFSGTVERRFNPSTFRYSLAEQLDISSRKWTAVDNFVYLCKLHGSINWVEQTTGLFRIRELQNAPADGAGRVMIFPTPAKQNASFASPYSDLFREFHARIIRDQSVLFVLGYSFGDEHVNNIIFQALTIPTFRMIAFVDPGSPGVVSQLRELNDPRIWIIGGDGPSVGRKAHYFDTFVEKFMPEPPGDKVDTAVAKVLSTLMAKTKDIDDKGDNDDI